MSRHSTTYRIRSFVRTSLVRVHKYRKISSSIFLPRILILLFWMIVLKHYCFNTCYFFINQAEGNQPETRPQSAPTRKIRACRVILPRHDCQACLAAVKLSPCLHPPPGCIGWFDFKKSFRVSKHFSDFCSLQIQNNQIVYLKLPEKLLGYKSKNCLDTEEVNLYSITA